MYGLWTTFTTQSGQRDNVIALLLEAAASFATHPGCLHYIISSSDEPDVLHVRKIWTDAAAHRASLTLPSTRQLIAQARPLLEHVERVLEDQPLGGKGLM
ncbi:putative quinol monooxygenase [Exiguobacterium acetylicum]|uniref:putative quinol monooxygenase n=1 Tax=Exiguobacterium acetylicum TaxID=41170 RepID=UPI00223C1057|nr:antibiotic biosynthesis monooxygenase [Exiguobacterium acetylicum]